MWIIIHISDYKKKKKKKKKKNKSIKGAYKTPWTILLLHKICLNISKIYKNNFLNVYKWNFIYTYLE